MPIRSEDSTIALPLSTAATARPSRALGIEREVIDLFDQLRNPLFRYVLSFGLRADDAEDLIQEVFLALFKHLQIRTVAGKPAGMGFPGGAQSVIEAALRQSETSTAGRQRMMLLLRRHLIRRPAQKSNC